MNKTPGQPPAPASVPASGTSSLSAYDLSILESLADQWAHMPLRNNFMFTKVFANDKPLCLELLRRMFPNLPIGDITYSEAEKTFQSAHDSRAIRMDVLADDGTHLFDLEMQTSRRQELPKRSRYYSSAADSEMAKPHMKYIDLKPSYVIFICTFPAFRDGDRHRYTFRRFCVEEQGRELHDETSIIFLCTQGKANDVDQPLRNFLEYLNDESIAETTDDAFIRQLHEAVVLARQNQNWRNSYMFWSLDINEERAEAHDEGRNEGRNEMLKEFIADGTLSDDRIASIAKVPVDDIRKLREEISSEQSA